jgi:type I restriction enzyme R subunit
MHRAMRQILPDAMIIGFTGTPLLKADKATTVETFGSFIHTYKFDEAVRDGVVLDLRYEARNIEQKLKGAKQVDTWFDTKTQGLTDLSKARLKQKWGTMQKVFSAKARAEMIVQDVLLDFATQPRLVSGRGNAMLVGDSVYQACKFYELFSQAGFKGKCAIVSSYVPNAAAIAKEDAGAGDTEELRKYEIYRKMLADYFGVSGDEAVGRIEEFEKDVTRCFIDEPGQMQLLIVVDKLLTGFDAPSATYLYIDKKMKDHSLFQAICRVNRLDGDDKTYGYVIDYRDLFQSLDKAIIDYTSGAFEDYAKDDVDGLLKDRLTQARVDLDDALENIRALCEPVEPPNGTLQYQHYFVSAEPGDADQIKANEPKRVQLYKGVAALVRAFGALANEMDVAGYTSPEAKSIKDEVAHYVAVRNEVEVGAGEKIDMKQFEAGMRALLDTYIQADPVEKVAILDRGLVRLIVEKGMSALDSLPDGIKNNPVAAAETIINNVRRTIVDERAMNPKYYDSMSQLLDDLIERQKEDAAAYADYLKDLVGLATQVGTGTPTASYPGWASTPARRALVDFVWPTDVDIEVEEVFRTVQNQKEHDWVSHPIRRKALARALHDALPAGFPLATIDSLLTLLGQHDEFR